MHTFDDVEEGIKWFNNNPSDLEYFPHINDTCFKHSMRFLEFLKHIGADVPKIFCHGDDACVFTWEVGTKKYYITIDDTDEKQFVIGKLEKGTMT